MISRSRFDLPTIVSLLFIIGALSAQVNAQTGPSILIKPWGEGSFWAETQDELTFQFDTKFKATGADADLFIWDSDGRIRLDKDNQEPRFVIGYSVYTMDIDSNAPATEGQFNDVAIVLGAQVGEVFDGCQLGLLGGVGNANDSYWDRGEAWYGIGAINFSKKLDDSSFLHFGLSHDGNRSIFPDVPLPYAMYVHKLNDQFTYQFGLPVSSFVWTPDDHWTIRLNYLVPVNVTGEVRYAFNDKFSVFTSYRQQLRAFATRGSDIDRIFYESSRADVGAQYEFAKSLIVAAGVGYLFDQSFEQGFDIRNTTNISDLDSGLAFFFRIEGTF
jgi:hypothetical protein